MATTVALIIVLQLFAELLRSLGMTMSFALGLIPVLVVSQTEGMKHGVFGGFVFGLVSLIMAVVGANITPMFRVAINPLVSVFPRIMVGVVVSGIFWLLDKKLNKHRKNLTSNAVKRRTATNSAISTLCGVLTNTILFLGMFLAFAHGRTFGETRIDIRYILTVIVSLNTVIEIILFTIIVPVIVLAITNSKRYIANHPTASENYVLEELINEKSNASSDDAIIEDQDDSKE